MKKGTIFFGNTVHNTNCNNKAVQGSSECYCWLMRYVFVELIAGIQTRDDHHVSLTTVFCRYNELSAAALGTIVGTDCYCYYQLVIIYVPVRMVANNISSSCIKSDCVCSLAHSYII